MDRNEEEIITYERQQEEVSQQSFGVEQAEPVQTQKKKEKEYFKLFAWGVIVGMLIALCIELVVWPMALKRHDMAKLASAETTETEKKDSAISKQTQEKMKLLEDSIKTYYLDEVDNAEMENGIYRGMVESLGDPYSTYYTNEELNQVKESTEGIYGGIGAYIGYDNTTHYCKITGIIPNTPAEEEHLQPEDIIYEIDGTNAYEMTTTDVVALIKGKEGTQVTLKLVRKGETDYLEKTLTRRAIEAPTVNYEMKEDGIAYIQITQFDTVTPGQFEEKMNKAREEGMKKLILDLRNNPGGTLESVVKIGNMLLPEGLIVYTEDKNGNRKEYKCAGEHPIDVPMVVLVNDNSASAAEILAGAIKDYKVGTLLGTTTFGKGIVQRVFSITDGSAVKLTVSHYYTPNGNDIHKKGVAPDEELEMDYDAYVDENVDNQLERAIEILSQK